MKQESRNIIVALVIVILGLLFLIFIINKSNDTINELNDYKVKELSEKIRLLDSVSNAEDSLLNQRTNALIEKHKNTISTKVVEKIKQKYVKITDSIRIMPTKSKTEFIRSIYVY